MNDHTYLIDTSVWIDLFRLKVPTDLSDRVRSLGEAQRLTFNQVIRLEILIGTRNRREFGEVEDELRGLVELPVGDSTWRRATILGFDLRRKGVTVPVPDLLIAASAIEHNSVVIHSDKHFDDIAKNSNLLVESYVKTANVTGT